MKKNCLCIIPARAGSKGVKNKNFKLLNGKPLIQYTIDVAKKIGTHCDIVVSSDYKKIKKICKKNKLEFFGFRPKRLSGDFIETIDVVRYELKKLEKIEKNIKKKKIRIIGNYIFQDKQIKKKFLTCGIGFLGKFQGRLNYEKNILISLGTAYLDRKYLIQFEKQINQITKNRDFEYCNIYLDKIFYNKFAHYKNIYRADYSESMFKKISIAIVKPGLGIINDCLSHGIYLISVELPFNREYLNNSNLINKNRLGKNSKSLIKGFEISQNILNKKQKLKNMFYRYKKLKWNGERNLYNYIRTIIK